jgi:glycosyltransferase involved in cell wall biosynthesis
MRIAILWSHLSGYLNACLRALAEEYGADLMVWHNQPSSDAPFAAEQFDWLSNCYGYHDAPESEAVAASLDSFNPHALLVTSWHIPAYRNACRALTGHAVRICCLDNQWRWTLRQSVGAVVAPWYVRPLYDAAFVPGRRQQRFARLLGFDRREITMGLYSCDHTAFVQVRERRIARPGSLPHGFLFAGRLCREKGLATLLSAYRIYCESSRAPWPLTIAGEGVLRGRVEREANVKYLGFVQPDKLPGLLLDAGCLVLPSRFEPWGVVIHEAVAAGLPIICTRECGAAEHLVIPAENGFLVNRDSPQELAACLAEFSSLSDDRRAEMGDRSFELSFQFTPRKWAGAVMGLIDRLQRSRVGAPVAQAAEELEASGPR